MLEHQKQPNIHHIFPQSYLVGEDFPSAQSALAAGFLRQTFTLEPNPSLHCLYFATGTYFPSLHCAGLSL